MTVSPALPMTKAEYEFLIRDGSLAGALAGMKLRFVYCSCGQTPKAEDWHGHLDRYQGARFMDEGGPHKAIAFERPTDYINDCMVWLGE